MEHDLKRYPRLLAKLLTGSALPLDCSVQGCISVWDVTHLGRKPSHRHPVIHACFSATPLPCATMRCHSSHLVSVHGVPFQSVVQHGGLQEY